VNIGTLAVVGTGLIGGSFARALREARVTGRVTGFDRDPAAREAAVRLGVVDEAPDTLAAAVAHADFILVATPVRAIEGVLAEIAPHLKPGATVTDTGSTKQDVVAASAALGEKRARFVPGHPIAGREESGVAAAIATLYRGAKVVLTPQPDTAPDALAAVRAAWQSAGATVVEMDAAAHDRVFAAVSHLPHLLAFALVSEIAGREDADRLFGFAAGGFRDFTRIASGSPAMWRDIALQNRTALLEELDRYAARLAEYRALVDQSDAQGLEEMMAAARDAREAWLKRYQAARSPE
jgi:prephenate dehydrogenase